MVFGVLGPSTRAAYLHLARAWGVRVTCLRALRHAGKAKKRPLIIAHFFRQPRAAERALMVGGTARPEPPETRERPARAAP